MQFLLKELCILGSYKLTMGTILFLSFYIYFALDCLDLLTFLSYLQELFLLFLIHHFDYCNIWFSAISIANSIIIIVIIIIFTWHLNKDICYHSVGLMFAQVKVTDINNSLRFLVMCGGGGGGVIIKTLVFVQSPEVKQCPLLSQSDVVQHCPLGFLILHAYLFPQKLITYRILSGFSLWGGGQRFNYFFIFKRTLISFRVEEPIDGELFGNIG